MSRIRFAKRAILQVPFPAISLTGARLRLAKNRFVWRYMDIYLSPIRPTPKRRRIKTPSPPNLQHQRLHPYLLPAVPARLPARPRAGIPQII